MSTIKIANWPPSRQVTLSIVLKFHFWEVFSKRGTTDSVRSKSSNVIIIVTINVKQVKEGLLLVYYLKTFKPMTKYLHHQWWGPRPNLDWNRSTYFSNRRARKMEKCLNSLFKFCLFLFSSPEDNVLKVSFCDGPLSVVHRPCVCVCSSTISF